MLIKTECLCKTGHQKCLPRGDGANEVDLLKLPIKVMFSRSLLLEEKTKKEKKKKSQKQTPRGFPAYESITNLFLRLQQNARRQPTHFHPTCSSLYQAAGTFELY